MALLAATLAVLASPPAAMAQTEAQTEVWSATLTVGQDLAGTLVTGVGYNRVGGATSGSLSDDSFDLAGTAYTVKTLRIRQPTSNNQLHLFLDPAPGGIASYLTLHIGSDAFPLSNATATTASNVTTYSWTGHGLSWSNNDTVDARLTYSRPPFNPCSGVDGCFEILTSSDLVPSGISAGSSFRLLFISSSTRDARSSDIGVYNSFVQAVAARGHAAIVPYHAHFTAVASTPDTDARDNTATTGTGVPIYWLDGNKAADDYTDFYDETWDDEANAKDESGSARSTSATTDYPWTGSKHDGTEARLEPFSIALGTSAGAFVEAGRPNSSTSGHGPLSGATGIKTNSRPLYALSPVLKAVSQYSIPTVTVPRNWPLTPDGLTAGDTFRLLFLTAVHAPTSSDIADYNAYAQAQAGADDAHPAIQSYRLGFRVVGSTADTDARDNTATTYTASEKGPPIYWLGGSKVADDYEDFYDETWDDEANPTQSDGTAASDDWAWTGSGHDGTEELSGMTSYALGAASVGSGRLNHAVGSPLRSGTSHGPLPDNGYYALSGVFTVGSEVVATEVPANWPLNPDGLTTGAEFRLLFITDAHSPTSADMAVYNAYVQAQAGADDAHAAIKPYSSGFRAVGSTADRDARDNTWTTYISTAKGLPIHWLGGTKVADEYEDFYDQSWDDEASPTQSDGTAASPLSGLVWTGSGHDGTERLVGTSSRALGATTVGSGRLNGAGSPLLSGTSHGTSAVYGYYALSDVFAIGSQVVFYNSAPVFADTAPATRSVAENSDAGTNVGAAVAATDVDTGDTLEYSLGGTDAASFEIDSTSGQIQTKAEVSYDHEAAPSYSVDVGVTDGTATVSIAVTITVTDVDEPPDAPAAPTVTTTAGTTDSLDASWTAPDNAGRPAITDYDVQYQAVGSATWIDAGHTGTGLSATLSGLDAGTAYKVQVRATNAEGTGAWSDPGQAPTGGPPTEVPADGGLVPDGLGPGDSFRLLFATSTTRDATSTDISDYNAFVQAAAAAGHADIQAHSAGFAAVGSTAAVDARDNTASRFDAMSADKGPPVYWLGGAKAADDYEDFYDGSWDDEANAKDESGDARSLSFSTSRPFTGSDHAGTESFSSGATRALGTVPTVRVARTNTAGAINGPLSSGISADAIDLRPFYALSPVFTVSSEVTVPPNWGLIPDGLGPGDSFRLLFATSTTRDASSTDIADYNTHVQNAAAAGHAAIQAYGAGFTVVGSTAATDARDNTATTYTDDDKGLPIHWLGGSQVADDYEDFYDGTWDDEANAKDESGDARSLSDATRPWTGSNHNGTAISSASLGDSFVKYGWPNSTGGRGPLSTNVGSFANTDTRPFYALSPVFTVGSEVTAPSNWSLKPTGLATGNRFRLLFATSTTRNGSSADIGVYNTHVQTAAAAGHADIQAYSSAFRVVASTAATDARDNTGTTYTDDDKGVPIHWLGGAKAADDYEDFYDGSWDDEANPKDESGSARSLSADADRPFTGSNNDGTESSTRTLGESLVRVGEPGSTVSARGPIDGNASRAGTQSRPFYALSPVFAVGSEVVAANSAPTFANPTEARSVAENSAASTNVGAVVTATDADNDPLAYTLEGTDAASFSIVSTSGQIQTESGVTYDHEAKSSYSVTVKAVDGNGGSATVAVTVGLTDVAEPPDAPDAPTVSATSGSTTSLDATWTAPANAGKPAITDYDVRYGVDGSGTWIDAGHTGTALSATLAGLAAGTAYEVQVRATNDEGTGAWSSSGTGTTGSPSTEVPADWSLIPTGLTSGDSFRLLFIPSTGTNAGSDDIGVYNSLVQTAAAAGHADIQAHSASFRMVGSTEAVDARDNTATTGTGVPIHWLGGARVADDYADFYDGDWDEEATGRRATGAAVALGSGWEVWTGSEADGTESGTGNSSRALGNGASSGTAWVKHGHPNHGTHGPLAGDTSPRSESKGVYALSGVFTVGAPVVVANNPPAFSDTTLTRSIAENSAADSNVGAVVPAATDTDVGDTLTYSMEGADAASFTFDAATRQIKTKDGVTYDFEADSSYSVTIKVSDGNGGSDTIAVTITLTNVAEQPARPAAPSVGATANTTNSLDVSWTAPDRNGGPALTGYELQSSKGNSGIWTSWAHSGTGTTATIAPLDANSPYQVQVRALNGEIASAWSPSGTGTTGANSLPVFTDTAPAARNVAENSAAGANVGAPVAATDVDTGDTLVYSLRSTGDDASFAIVTTSGQIQTISGQTYDRETKPSYSVQVSVTDGTATVSIAVTITLTNVLEQPAAPAAPTVTATANTSDSLDVSWTAPDRNGGPALTGYEVQYRRGTSAPWTAWAPSGTGTTATIVPLDANSAYQVRVRALNGETPSDWSPSGSGTTGAPALPGLSIADSSASEGAGAMAFAVTLSEAGSAQVTVAYATFGGSATQGTDYTAASGTLTFAPGDTAETITVTLTDDTLVEGDETFQVTLSAPQQATLADATATGTITDNDQASTAIALSLNPDRVTEGGGARSITATVALDGAPRTTATPVTVSHTGGDATSGTDYQAVSSFALTIPAQQASETATFTFTPVDDTVEEGDETVVLRASATDLADGTATLTIGDDDQASVAVLLGVSPSSVSESGGARSVRVTATLDASARAAATDVVVSLHSQDAEFGPGRDAAVVAPFTITIEPGRTGASGRFTLRPHDDALAEGTESIEVRGEATGLRVEPATLELTDNDTATVNLAVPYKSRHSEGGGATHVTVEATLDTMRSAATVVTVEVRGSGRAGVSGFEAVDDFELTIPAGRRRNTEGGFMLYPENDDQAEADETLTISGRAAGLRVTGTTFLLEDDDSEAASTTVTLELNETRLAESGGAHVDLTVTGTLDGAPRAEDTVATLTPSNRASDGSEVTALVDSGMRLTIRAGRISGRRTFGIVLNTPGIDQADGMLTLGGTADGGLTVEPATLELLDRDAPPDTVALTPSRTRVPEGWRGPVWVTAEMTPSARTAETVLTLNVGGTGAGGAVDFTPVAAFELTIPKAWEAYGAKFDLYTEDDGTSGGNETLTVSGTTDVAGLRVRPATLTLVDGGAAQALDFPYFANGDSSTTEIVLLNPGPRPVRPAIHFSDPGGGPIAPASVVDLTRGLAVRDDGGLTFATAIAPMAMRTVATHGRGPLLTGSATVRADGVVAGILRHRVPDLGTAAMAAGEPLRDALLPVRSRAGGGRTAVALHNVGAETTLVGCRLIDGGVTLEQREIALPANGQTSWYVDEAFAATATTDSPGLVRCTAPGDGLFTAAALQTDAGNGIFAALPALPVDHAGGDRGATVLSFAQFAAGTGTASELLLVNPSARPRGPLGASLDPAAPASRPTVYFRDAQGEPIDPALVVDLTGDVRVTDAGGLTPRREMAPLGVLAITTRGRGEPLSGSIRVVSDSPLGGFLRVGLPDGVAVVAAAPPIGEAVFPVRGRAGGIDTRVAMHNLESTTAVLNCDLLREGALLDIAGFLLMADGQLSRTIAEMFPAAAAPDLAGSVVRCVSTGRFTAMALETEPGTGTSTALPAVKVDGKRARE